MIWSRALHQSIVLVYGAGTAGQRPGLRHGDGRLGGMPRPVSSGVRRTGAVRDILAAASVLRWDIPPCTVMITHGEGEMQIARD